MKPIRTKYEDRIEYRLNGYLHREDGPAIIYPDGDMQWYFNGEVVSNPESHFKLHFFQKE